MNYNFDEMNFVEKIKAESNKGKYTKDDLLRSDYFIASEKNLEIYFAPFDYVNTKASVVIVGITPGWSQMEKAFRTVITELHDGSSYESALRTAKSEASFAGSMRTNLVKMLDELKLHEKLRLVSTAALFDVNSNLLHSTSALRYPVFSSGKNYTGSAPAPLKSKLLCRQINNYLIPEMSSFTDALIIPLGKNVNNIFLELQSNDKLNGNTILSGFPHPSGANGHRAKEFELNKTQMAKKIDQWKQ